MKNGHAEFSGRVAAPRRARVWPMTWEYLCKDRRFQDLPYKVELNGRGQIIMSPTKNFHGFFAAKFA